MEIEEVSSKMEKGVDIEEDNLGESEEKNEEKKQIITNLEKSKTGERKEIEKPLNVKSELINFPTSFFMENFNFFKNYIENEKSLINCFGKDPQ